MLVMKEMAAYLKVAGKTICRLVGSKKLPGFKIGGIWRFKKNEIEHWINQSLDVLGVREGENEKTQ